MTRVARIAVYPIKALDGVDVPRASLLATGALDHDRRYALFDDAGHYVNGKRHAPVHAIRVRYQLANLEATLTAPRLAEARFRLKSDRADAGRWLSRALAKVCVLEENPAGGFPDDRDAPGPTLISTPTIDTVADWFDLPPDECRRRFRANIEIEAPHAFWEDQLAGATFTIAGATFLGTGVCQRCVVPSRDSRTGDTIAGFQKQFAQRREHTLPKQSPRHAFNHYYRVAINTRMVSGGGTLSLGDALTIVG